jgi:adenylylsulfate kinase
MKKRYPEPRTLNPEPDANPNHVTWFDGYVNKEDREQLHGHKGATIWFTGLSASGKSTIAHHLEKLLHDMNCSTYVFDGDNVRHGLCGDLGFSENDRAENIRRIGEMVMLFVDAGIIAITAFISPYRKDRRKIRELVGKDDQKGIYEKARAGIIKEFTGISAPYEPPKQPTLVIKSDSIEAVEAAKKVLNILRNKEIIA